MAAAIAPCANDLRSSARPAKKSRKNRAKTRSLSAAEDFPPEDLDSRKCSRFSRGDEAEEVGFRSADWGDAMEAQLRELLLGCLDVLYRSAVKRIEACGYSEDAATRAILMSEFSCKGKEAGRSVLGDALSVLRNGGEVGPGPQVFGSLEEMERHVLEEMVSVLREARPFFSAGDAMWCLLVCDMDMQRAFGVHLDPYAEEIQWHTSSSSQADRSCNLGNSLDMTLGELSKCKNLEQLAPSIEGVLQSMIGINELPIQKSGSKCGAVQPNSRTESLLNQVKRCQGSRSKRDSILRQRYYYIEKSYPLSCLKGTMRANRFGNLGSLITDRKCRSLVDPAGINMRNAMAKIGRTTRPNISEGEGVPMSSAGSGAHVCPHGKAEKCNSSLLVMDNEAPLSSSSATGTTDGNSAKLRNTSPAGISRDFDSAKITLNESAGKCIPDKKDILLLNLNQHMDEMHMQLEDWKKWAEQKVVQAAHRLRKDKAEIQVLRQAKDEVGRLNKEKETLEQNTLKKFMEMENAISKASDQVTWASGAKSRLESENAELRLEMEAAKLRALKSVDSYHEASKRETEIMKKMQSWDRQKPLLQEELMIEKRKLSELQEKLNQAIKYQHQLEASFRQEEKLKDEVLTQANSFAKEREELETSAKSEEDCVRSRIDGRLRKQRHIIEKLEGQIVRRKQNVCLPNMVVPSWEVNGDKIPAPGIVNIYSFSELHLQESECGYHVPPERECVMCLTEEKSILFLPCAHQVVCVGCNSIHEKQGMKDCPSCRTLIEKRIPVRFLSSRDDNTPKSGTTPKNPNAL